MLEVNPCAKAGVLSFENYIVVLFHANLKACIGSTAFSLNYPQYISLSPLPGAEHSIPLEHNS